MGTAAEGSMTTQPSSDAIKAEVERRHAEIYPNGCPRGCEACAKRVPPCPRCGGYKVAGQSCGCFDNDSQ